MSVEDDIQLVTVMRPKKEKVVFVRWFVRILNKVCIKAKVEIKAYYRKYYTRENDLIVHIKK